MISPDEIKRQALRWWNQVLQCYMRDETFSPMQIDRIGKIQSGAVRQQYEKLQKEIEELYRHSKNQTGTGYLVQTSGHNFRRSGNLELPDSIVFESLEDYLHTTGKKKEWALFVKNYNLITGSIPSLTEWGQVNTLWLVKPDIDWNNIMKVCRYFILTPRPDMHIRQLPIEIHTKFIEENAALLQSLLDFLIPGHIRNGSQKRFAERYYLKYDEPLIRIRILDETLQFQHKIRDLSIPLSSFLSLNIDCNRIIITENKMNFLTLPEMRSAIALWSGGGFNVSYLQNIHWLADKDIYYWGDFDEHGLQILHQLRSYYGKAKSIMMDMETYLAFERFAVSTDPAGIENLTLLKTEEMDVLKMLQSNPLKNRLEQEKIANWYVLERFSGLM